MRIFVTEFADSKQELERDLKVKTDAIIEHLFKLYLMPNNVSRNRWKREIANFLYKISKLAGKNKFPTYKQLYSWTYLKFQDVITDTRYMKNMINDFLDEYKDDIKEIRKTYPQICDEFDNICSCYFKWLCENLSEVGLVSRSDIFNKLDDIV